MGPGAFERSNDSRDQQHGAIRSGGQPGKPIVRAGDLDAPGAPDAGFSAIHILKAFTDSIRNYPPDLTLKEVAQREVVGCIIDAGQEGRPENPG